MILGKRRLWISILLLCLFFVSSFVWAEGDLGTYKFLGEIYQRQERYEKAINLYQEAIKKFPEEASKFQYLIGESYREAKDFPQALEAFSKLIKSYPESEEAPRAQLAIARIYGYRLGDYERAFKEYERFINNYPQSNRGKT